MIKTPVKRHDMFTSSFVDKHGCFLDDAQMNDAKKRINMHDEFVNAIQDVKDFTDWYYTGKADGDRPKKPLNEIANNISELLERCK